MKFQVEMISESSMFGETVVVKTNLKNIQNKRIKRPFIQKEEKDILLTLSR